MATTTRRNAAADAARDAAVRALMTRSAEVRTVELLTRGTYTLVEVLGAEREAVVNTLLPQGRDGIRPAWLPAHDVKTWAVYDAEPVDPNGRNPRRRGTHEVIGYVMNFCTEPFGPLRYWAEYVSDEQDDMCHAGHERTLERAVAAITRYRAGEVWIQRKRLEAEALALRALDADPFEDL